MPRIPSCNLPLVLHQLCKMWWIVSSWYVKAQLSCHVRNISNEVNIITYMLYFKLHVNVNYIHAINAAPYGHVEKPLTLPEKFQENPLLCISIFSIPVSREKYVHNRHVNKGGLSHKYKYIRQHQLKMLV